MRALLVLSLALGATALGVPLKEQKIVGGEPTTINRHPHLVSMQYYRQTQWESFCGGALITSRTILSASHCYYNEAVNMWRARVGSSYASSGGQIINLYRFVLHPDYDNRIFANDVAIVYMSYAATLGDTVQTVAIAAPSYSLADGTRVTVAGWGKIAADALVGEEQLREIDVYTINRQLCAERYRYLQTIEPEFLSQVNEATMFCAGILDEGGKDSCQGDSGGPLVYHQGGMPVVVGVVSWGYQCATPMYPGVYADVAYFSDWIVANGNPSPWEN